MVAITHAPPFDVLTDPKPNDTSFPAFMVSTERGFLPGQEPIDTLPLEFGPLDSLLKRMPIKTASGEPGLLANGSLGDQVHSELSDLSDAVEKYRADLPLMTAVYRDYSFLASAYLLEPCHMRFVQGKEYGLGRQVLPACIAKPMAKVSEIVGFKPWMEYAGSYALYNYRLADPSLGLSYSNLRLIRAFEHGLDPSSSEAGFVLVHVAMASHSGLLVSGATSALDACAVQDREAFIQGMEEVIDAMRQINTVMNTMWTRSKPGNYTQFRTFIFGITSQSMFPDGVVYEGVSEEPLSFRGESGANDSIIPLMDSLLLIPMPDTPLTEILKDFRAYRPGNHRTFLESVYQRAGALRLKEFALADLESAALYVEALDQVRDFRWRHWCFAKEYILRQTKHPTATGGSPIVTWLPNQLQAVLSTMLDAAQHCAETAWLRGVKDGAESQLDSLEKEVQHFSEERGA